MSTPRPLTPLVPILLVLLGLAPALRAAVAGTGAPKLLLGDATIQSSGGVQHFPAIAAGDGTYLTAWPDHRAGFETLTAGVGTHDLYAMRTASDGTTIDPVPFRVASGPGQKSRVEVAWNGTHWLVTWMQETDNGFAGSIELLGARVAPSGDVVDATPISIRKFQWSSHAKYALGCDGSGFAVVLQGTSSGEAGVEGRLVSASGVVTPAATASLLSSTSLWGGFTLHHVGGRYLLIAQSGGGTTMTARLLTGALAPVGGTFSLGTGGAASITDDGAAFHVAYVIGGVGAQIAYRRVTPTGQVGPQVVATPQSIVEYAYDPDITWNGNGFTIVYTHGLFPPTDLRFARVAANGALLDFGGLPLNHGVEPHNPRIASVGDGRAQIAWYDWSTTPPHFGDVTGALVAADATVGPSTPHSSGMPRQGHPDLAAGGEGYVAVFTSERNGSVSILAHRLDPFGNCLDAEPIELAVGDALGHPRVAWNGAHFLIVFEDRVDLGISTSETNDVTLARRLAPDGTSPDTAPFQVLPGGTPDVAAAGDRFLVVASRAETSHLRRIHAARVDGQGGVLDPTPVVVSANFATRPSAASFGDRWVVAWDRKPTHDSTLHDARVRVVQPDLTLTAELSLGSGTRPCAAASPNFGLVAWLQGGEVVARRVDKNGVIQPLASVLTGAAGLQLHPSAAWTGDQFLVAWEDERAQPLFLDHRLDVYAAHVQEDGVVVDFDGFAVGDDVEHEQMPAVAAANGSALIAYALHRPDAPEANVRIAVDNGGLGGVFRPYGAGCPGAGGVVPALVGHGTPGPGATISVEVQAGPAGGASLVYVGTAPASVPFQGCTFLVGGALLAPITLPLDASGAVKLTATIPAATPANVVVDLQALCADPGAANGVFSATNGLELKLQ